MLSWDGEVSYTSEYCVTKHNILWFSQGPGLNSLHMRLDILPWVLLWVQRTLEVNLKTVHWWRRIRRKPFVTCKVNLPKSSLQNIYLYIFVFCIYIQVYMDIYMYVYINRYTILYLSAGYNNVAIIVLYLCVYITYACIIMENSGDQFVSL